MDQTEAAAIKYNTVNEDFFKISRKCIDLCRTYFV